MHQEEGLIQHQCTTTLTGGVYHQLDRSYMAVTQRSNIIYWILTGHPSEYLRVRDQHVDSTLDDTNVSLAYIGHLCSSNKMRHHRLLIRVFSHS